MENIRFQQEYLLIADNASKNGYSFNDCLAVYGDQRHVFKAGRYNIDVGDSGAGKTTFSLRKAICSALGQDYYGLQFKQPTLTIYLNTEQSQEELVRRYFQPFYDLHSDNKDALDCLDNLLYIKDYLTLKGSMLNDAASGKTLLKELEDLVTEARIKSGQSEKVIANLIIDPMYCLLGGKSGNNANAVRFITNPLRDFCEEHNIAVSLVTHTHRHSNGQLLGQKDIQGASNIFNAADSIFTFEAPNGVDSKKRMIRCIKGEPASDGFCVEVAENPQKFLGDWKVGKPTYDHYELRTMPETKASELYKLLRTIYPTKTVSDNQVEYMIKRLRTDKIIVKVKGKNAYVGMLNGQPQQAYIPFDSIIDLAM